MSPCGGLDDRATLKALRFAATANGCEYVRAKRGPSCSWPRTLEAKLQQTHLITMHIHFDGWFDTGATAFALSVGRHLFTPGGGAGSRLGQREELLGYRGEVFLTDHATQDLTMRMNKAFSTFSTAMSMP